jgi:hypothetical protein
MQYSATSELKIKIDLIHTTITTSGDIAYHTIELEHKQRYQVILLEITWLRYHKILFIPGEPIFVFRSIHDEVYVSFPQLDNTISII